MPGSLSGAATATEKSACEMMAAPMSSRQRRTSAPTGRLPRWRPDRRRRISASRTGTSTRACLLLGDADFGDQGGTLHQQAVQLVVGLVDLPSQGFERARWLGGHGGIGCGAGVFDSSKGTRKQRKH